MNLGEKRWRERRGRYRVEFIIYITDVKWVFVYVMFIEGIGGRNQGQVGDIRSKCMVLLHLAGVDDK